MPEKTKPKLPLFCLTGGIATGKSRVADWFAVKGWRVICTDTIVHHLYQFDQDLIKTIVQSFGPNALTKEGSINRSELGKIVFQDHTALQRLNALVHPRVRVEWKKQSTEALHKKEKTLVVIPLAFETCVEKEFSEVWVVACSIENQKLRLQERGLNKKQIEERISAQWPIQKKIDLADRVVWNDGAWSLTEQQLEQIFLNPNA